MREDYHCPICSKKLKFRRRYPQYVCAECVEKATDKDGRPLEFYNQSILGGFQAFYKDSREIYNKHECYIEGVLCYAEEARFGGIVIQKQSIAKNTKKERCQSG